MSTSLRTGIPGIPSNLLHHLLAGVDPERLGDSLVVGGDASLLPRFRSAFRAPLDQLPHGPGEGAGA